MERKEAAVKTAAWQRLHLSGVRHGFRAELPHPYFRCSTAKETGIISPPFPRGQVVSMYFQIPFSEKKA